MNADYDEKQSMHWLIIRVCVAISGMVAGIALPEAGTNVDWLACALMSGISSVALFGYLWMIRFQSDIEWSTPYAATTPFFPMRTYPLRFWVVSSYSAIAAGIALIGRNVVDSPQYLPLGVLLLALGVMFNIVVLAFSRLAGVLRSRQP